MRFCVFKCVTISLPPQFPLFRVACVMDAGEISGPDEATKEKLMTFTQRLLHKMVSKRRPQTEETLPIKFCITGNDERRR